MSLFRFVDGEWVILPKERPPAHRRRKLNKRDRNMAALYRNGETLAAIGLKYGVSRERVRQILARQGMDRMDGGITIRVFKKTEDRAKMEEEKKSRKELRDFSTYGMSSEKISQISPIKRSDKDHPIRKFESQRGNAKQRGIEWQLSFAEWWEVWQESGRWAERGRGSGYVMARWADDGPYSVDNVYICTAAQNSSDSYITKPSSERTKKAAITREKRLGLQ